MRAFIARGLTLATPITAAATLAVEDQRAGRRVDRCAFPG